MALDKKELRLEAQGATGTLTAIVSPSDANNKAVIWKTSDETVATVSGGVVTPLSAGSAVISVATMDGSYTAICTVTVVIPVTGVTLDETEIDLKVGNIFTLTATVSPANATNKNMTWSSSAESVATVSNGVVTPRASGEAIISVTTEDGSKSASCTVTVEAGSTGPAGRAIRTSRSETSFVRVPGLDIPQDFTLEVWVKPDSLSSLEDQIVISKEPVNAQNNQFRVGINNNKLYFMMSDDALNGGLWIKNGPSYQVATWLDKDLDGNDRNLEGQWLHIAVTKSGEYFNLYLNGVNELVDGVGDKKEVFEYMDIEHTGTVDLAFGTRWASGDGSSPDPSSCFDGIIDEIRIWNIGRPADDIKADMNKTISPNHKDYGHLMAYYQFDEVSGTTVVDTKGSYNGTLVNNPARIESEAPINE